MKKEYSAWQPEQEPEKAEKKTNVDENKTSAHNRIPVDFSTHSYDMHHRIHPANFMGRGRKTDV